MRESIISTENMVWWSCFKPNNMMGKQHKSTFTQHSVFSQKYWSMKWSPKEGYSSLTSWPLKASSSPHIFRNSIPPGIISQTITSYVIITFSQSIPSHIIIYISQSILSYIITTGISQSIILYIIITGISQNIFSYYTLSLVSLKVSSHTLSLVSLKVSQRKNWCFFTHTIAHFSMQHNMRSSMFRHCCSWTVFLRLLRQTQSCLCFQNRLRAFQITSAIFAYAVKYGLILPEPVLVAGKLGM